MSLAGVLVDTARVWSFTEVLGLYPDDAPGTDPHVLKVEGETQMEWQPGEWFACRVDSPEAAEAEDAAGGRVRTDQRPTLIYELEDEQGAPVLLTADSRVEVVSEELGTAMYELGGQPTLYRKKQDLVAGQASLKRILTFPVLAEAP